MGGRGGGGLLSAQGRLAIFRRGNGKKEAIKPKEKGKVAAFRRREKKHRTIFYRWSSKTDCDKLSKEKTKARNGKEEDFWPHGLN